MKNFEMGKLFSFNKRGLFVLLAVFSFMYILNCLTPMLNEDYFASFVWPQGVQNLGALPEDTKRVSSFADVLENCRVYYLTEGGRLPGGFLLGAMFGNLEKVYFNLFNAWLMTLLVVEIYWLSHEGKVTLDFKPVCLIAIFFSLWSFNVTFVDTCLWIAGSSNYLWMMVIVFAFLIPYVRNYYNPESLCQNNPVLTAGMFFIGIIAGWSHETSICWLILSLFYWLYLCKKNKSLQYWKVSGFVGLCIGYALLIFAPGNFARLAVQQQANSVLTVSELYRFKLTEAIWIFLFHFFLWFFIVRAFFTCHNKIKNMPVAALYFNFAKTSSLIAIGSGIFMFLIPASTWRPSFLNLAFLTVAVASLFRMQEVTSITFINEKAKLFLKVAGAVYLIMTCTVALWCNYVNWNHWNSILVKIRQEQVNPTNTVLEVEPYFTDGEPLLQFGSGFHLIYMPVVYGDENDKVNAAVAKYYGIKGLAKRQK